MFSSFSYEVVQRAIRSTRYWKGCRPIVSKPWSVDYGATVYHWAIWLADDRMGIKVAYVKYQIHCFSNQSSVRHCHKMTNCEQFRKKCRLKNSSDISYHKCLFEKMRQECYDKRESLIFFPSEKSWNLVTSCYYYWKIVACCINI